MSVARHDVEDLLSSLGPQAAVLHGLPGWDPRDAGGGDIDCVVPGLDRSWPLRLGDGWCLCQCLHYDITGWYWVLERDGEVVRLDTLDDPDGIGSYGVPTDRTRRIGTMAPPHLRAAYLTAKRLRKWDGDPGAWADIRAMAGEQPESYREAVQEVVGSRAGRSLAEAVIRDGRPSEELRRRARNGQRRRRFRTPDRLVRISALELARLAGRVRRPTGLLVLVVGPDGSGKSTVARALPDACRGLFRRNAHLHWSPGVLPRPGALLRRDRRDPSRPHAAPTHGRGTSLALLGYHWLDFQLGGLLRVVPLRARTGLVVMERGWWDIAVDPARYRLDVPAGLVRLLGGLLQRPDLVLALEAPPDVIHARKPELGANEIKRQQEGWRPALPSGVRTVPVDVSRPIEEVVRSARDRVVQTLEARTASRIGCGWVSLPTGRRPRWTLPRGPRGVARNGLLVYQPVTPLGLAGWRTARLLAAAGGFRLLPRGSAPPRAVRTAAAPFVPPGGAIAVARSNHPGRWVALVLGEEGAGVAVVKVALGPSGREALAREAAVLDALSLGVSSPLRAPEMLGHDEGLLALGVVPWRPRSRPWELPQPVAEALGNLFGEGWGHGDVAPWNLLETAEGWTLVDWELAGDDVLPFFDPFHYVVQSHALLGRPNADEIVRGVKGVGALGAVLRTYAGAAGLAFDDARVWFTRYLDESARSLDRTRPDGRAGLQARRQLMVASRSGT